MAGQFRIELDNEQTGILFFFPLNLEAEPQIIPDDLDERTENSSNRNGLL